MVPSYVHTYVEQARDYASVQALVLRCILFHVRRAWYKSVPPTWVLEIAPRPEEHVADTVGAVPGAVGDTVGAVPGAVALVGWPSSACGCLCLCSLCVSGCGNI